MVDVIEREPVTKAERLANALAHLRRAEDARLARALFDLQRAEVAYIEQYREFSRHRGDEAVLDELRRAELRVEDARREASVWNAVTHGRDEL